LSFATDHFQSLIANLSTAAIRVGHRNISSGDENALRPEESVYFRNAAIVVQRQSGAARLIARKLIWDLCGVSPAILKSPSGAPVCPPGIAVSLAHHGNVAVAAVAKTTEILSLGIDIEPATPLPTELVEIVSTATERLRYGKLVCQRRDLFVAKEAVYKAAHAIDGIFLDFQDIETNFDDGTARVCYGRTFVLSKIDVGTHVAALAHIAA
jgi:4'-phosphopantetheinyl transferase EntD